MEVEFASAKLLRGLFEAVAEIAQNVSVDVAETGLSICELDGSHVCLMVVELGARDASVFSAFRLLPGAPRTLGVHVPHLLRALKCAEPDDRVLLSASADRPDTLSLAFASSGAYEDVDAGAGAGADADAAASSKPAGARKKKAAAAVPAGRQRAAAGTTKKTKRTACFELRLVAIESERMDVPDRSDAARFTLSSRDFGRAVRDLAGIGDQLRLHLVQDHDEGMGMDEIYEDEDPRPTRRRLVMECEGDIGRATVAHEEDAAHRDEPGHRGDARPASFSLKHVVSISKACALTDDVTLELLDGMPACFEFRLTHPEADADAPPDPDAPSGSGPQPRRPKPPPPSWGRFYLAPKVSDEDAQVADAEAEAQADADAGDDDEDDEA